MKITDEMVNAADSVLSRVRPGINDGQIRLALQAALSASPTGVVKPLEWVDRSETIEDRYKASSVVGDYYVRREKSGLFSWRLPALRGSVVVGDAEAAKSAAFADYSARIMSAIEPDGVGVETGAFVLVPRDGVFNPGTLVKVYEKFAETHSIEQAFSAGVAHLMDYHAYHNVHTKEAVHG